ncbi:MAG: hypothetical protein ACTHMC_01375 [Pseudobacter sp.]|uniref:hypothetical protein n=1 Tax=Pseudobacter sp. TaxID=2045420 RepID=UPI003F7EB253
MKTLSWGTITVQQFQDIHRLSLTPDIDDFERVERAICILFDMTEQQLGDLPVKEFTALARQCTFALTDQVPGKPVKSFRIGRKKYAITYDPTKLRHRQYVEILTFGDKPIENMHYIMASLVQPVRWGMRRKNEAKDHEAISADMLNAKLVDVYHSCVFFCKLWLSLMERIRASLVFQMMQTGMTQSTAQELLSSSINAMAGFIQPGKWQNLNV